MKNTTLLLTTIVLFAHQPFRARRDRARRGLPRPQRQRSTRRGRNPAWAACASPIAETWSLPPRTGTYELPVTDDTIIFVAKPRGWQTRIDEKNMPRFYYIHKPEGSPDDDYKFPGVEPTGTVARVGRLRAHASRGAQ